MKRRRFLRASLTIAAGGLSFPAWVVAFVRSGGSSEAEIAIPMIAKPWISEIDGIERLHELRAAIAEALAVPPELMMMHPESYSKFQMYL